MLTPSQAKLLDYLYRTYDDDFVSVKLLYGAIAKKLEIVSIRNIVYFLYKKGYLERVYQAVSNNPVKGGHCVFSYRISDKGIVALASAEKRGECPKCHRKGRLTYFQGKFICNKCFLAIEDLSIDQFIYSGESIWDGF